MIGKFAHGFTAYKRVFGEETVMRYLDKSTGRIHVCRGRRVELFCACGARVRATVGVLPAANARQLHALIEHLLIVRPTDRPN